MILWNIVKLYRDVKHDRNVETLAQVSAARWRCEYVFSRINGRYVLLRVSCERQGTGENIFSDAIKIYSLRLLDCLVMFARKFAMLMPLSNRL